MKNLEHIIAERANDIVEYHKMGGRSFDECVSYVKEASTLGYLAWRNVVRMAKSTLNMDTA